MRAYKILPKEIICAANLSKAALCRLEWFDWYHTHGENISLTCRHFGISRDTFYRWEKRFHPYNLKSLEFDTKTRRPHEVRTMTIPLTVRQLVYEIRKADPEKSKYEIQAELKRMGILLGYNTIQKVINRHQELKNIHHKKKIRKHRNYKIARIRAARELRERYPGSLVQMDTKYLYVVGKKFYLFSAVDCKSRYGFIWCYKSISSLSGKDFVCRVRAYFPFPIYAINTDNGSEYLKEFHKEVISWGIPHFFTDPHCPKQNGRVERFHQTAEYEYFNYQDDLLDNLTMINERCMEFNTKYNTKRFHQSLRYKTPDEYMLEYLATQKGESVRYL